MGWLEFFDKSFEFFEIFADDFVVVAAVSVAGNFCMVGFQFWLFVIIVSGENDDGFCAGEDFC